MFKAVLPCAAALVLIVASAAMADDDGGVSCNPEGSQQEMNACSHDDYQKADRELNDAYRQALDFASGEDSDLKDQPDLQGAVATLKRAQRGWIDYRNGQCESYGFTARGGSMEPMLIDGCKADLTRKRTAELKALINGSDMETDNGGDK